LVDDRARMRAMGHAARAWSLRHVPTWHEVVVDDLLSVWRQLAFSPARDQPAPADADRALPEIGAHR
jgi:hypothetical protein